METQVKNRRYNEKNCNMNKRDNKPVSMNLLPKFEDVRENNNITTINIIEKLMNSPDEINNEDIVNELQNKINTYKQVASYQHELNNIYVREVQNFVGYFEKKFEGVNVNANNGLLKIKESFAKMEYLIQDNIHILDINEDSKDRMFLSKKDMFLKNLEKLFSVLEDSLNNNSADNDKMNDFLCEIKDYVCSNEDMLKDGKEDLLLPETYENVVEFSCGKNTSKSVKRKTELLDTVYLKKSRSRYCDKDVIIQHNLDEKNLQKIITKTDRLFLRNFMHVYLIKENGIFSESYFSKNDKMYSYKNFRFYEVKYYFSREEDFKDIKKYIELTRKLYSKYIMLYKIEDKDKKFMKLTISGVGKRQTLMKRHLINYMSETVKMDCLVKISMYSNIYDCMSTSLKGYISTKGSNSNANVKGKKPYYIYSNFNESLLNKLISSLE